MKKIHKNLLIKGKKIYLRLLKKEDINEDYLKWFRDKKITRYLEVDELSEKEAIEHLEYGLDTNTYYVLAICCIKSKKHIGNIKIGPFRKKHLTSDMPVFIGDRSYHASGAALEALNLGAKFAFEDLGMRKLCGAVIKENIASLWLYQRAGWKIECTRPNQYLIGLDSHDEVFIALYKND